MAIIFLTGMSGVGKSSILGRLGKLGFNVVDTDYGYTKVIRDGDDHEETIWDEDKIIELINNHNQSHLFLSGCYSNQAKFYQYFDHIVLLTASLDIILERLNCRTTNNYGKSLEDQAEVIDNYLNVLPLIERSSDLMFDTSKLDVNNVCSELIRSLTK